MEVGFPTSTVVVCDDNGSIVVGGVDDVVVVRFGFVVSGFGSVVVGAGSVVEVDVVVTMTQLMSGHAGYSRRGSSSTRWLIHRARDAAKTRPDAMVARPMR